MGSGASGVRSSAGPRTGVGLLAPHTTPGQGDTKGDTCALEGRLPASLHRLPLKSP